MTVADKLRMWRKAKGYGRAIACRELGVSKRTLEAWEQGRYEPGPEHLARIDAVLRGRHETTADLAEARTHVQRAIERLQSAMDRGSQSMGIMAGGELRSLVGRLQTIERALSRRHAEAEKLTRGECALGE